MYRIIQHLQGCEERWVDSVSMDLCPLTVSPQLINNNKSWVTCTTVTTVPWAMGYT